MVEQSNPNTDEKQEATHISIQNAGTELGVSRTTVYYYIEALSIEVTKYPLDRKAYISIVDLNRIKAAKKAAEEGLQRGGESN